MTKIKSKSHKIPNDFFFPYVLLKHELNDHVPYLWRLTWSGIVSVQQSQIICSYIWEVTPSSFSFHCQWLGVNKLPLRFGINRNNDQNKLDYDYRLSSSRDFKL